MILDIPVQLTVELGRTAFPSRTSCNWRKGSVVELDAMAGEPMDVLVNGFLIAQGEVVVVNDKFGIRLTDIVTRLSACVVSAAAVDQGPHALNRSDRGVVPGHHCPDSSVAVDAQAFRRR